MPRATGVVVAVALLGGLAVARGGALRVSKRPPLSKLHMYWVEPTSRAEAVIYALPAELNVGEEYDVIDSQGFVGRLRVKTVQELDPKCKTLTLKQGSASFVSAPVRDGSDMVALGPNKDALERARVVPPPNGEKPPEPANLYQRIFVDLDGDQTADLMRDAYACPPNQQPQGGQNAYCYDTFGRPRRGAWALVEHTVMRYCY